jgi:hypothetical protein
MQNYVLYPSSIKKLFLNQKISSKLIITLIIIYIIQKVKKPLKMFSYIKIIILKN